MRPSDFADGACKLADIEREPYANLRNFFGSSRHHKVRHVNKYAM